MSTVGLATPSAAVPVPVRSSMGASSVSVASPSPAAGGPDASARSVPVTSYTPGSATAAYTASTAGGDQRFLHVTQMPGSLETAQATYEALLNVQTRGGQMQVWEQAPDDALAEIMGRNASGTTQQGRLAGVGSALLEQVASTGAGYRQTIMNIGAAYSPGQIQRKAADALWAFQSRPSASAELSIETASGAKVRLSITDQKEYSPTGSGMSVSIEVDGELTAQERDALKALAAGFDAAVQGLAGDEPRLDLEKLLQFDSKALGRVELKFERYGFDNEGKRVLELGADLRLDASRREVEIKTREGVVAMNTDLRQPAQWGSAAQKDRAVAQYLGRIDQAAERGRANPGLVELFKSTFSAMHASYPSEGRDSSRLGISPGALPLRSDAQAFSAEDQSLMTGLADFHASIAATTRATNPRRTQERDQFQYTLNQSTDIAGTSRGTRAVAQTQTSKLSAAYHQSLLSSAAPKFDSTAASQNYYYNTVEDSSTTEMRLAYDDDEPTRATLTHQASQSLHSLKVENNQVVGSQTTPGQQSSYKDLLPLIKELKRQQRDQEASERDRQDTLDALHTLVLQVSGA
ncbi:MULTISPECIES: hypothetical protein [unclassified Acidovorax]|uniref:hypothetical protein n=1 Tax=unclassified Acidovorax TaxID=2684926 RepID=UPI000AAEADFE|nr:MULTISPECIES: hypothetical protein [unclassified Acidovorax]